MSKDFENKAKSLGDDFKLQPRENVWMRIEEALDENKRRRVAWWWWAAPVVLLLGSGILYVSSQQADNNKAADVPTATTSKTTDPASNNNIANTTEPDKSDSKQPSAATDISEPQAIQNEINSSSKTLSEQHIEPAISKNQRKKSIQPENKYSSYGLDQHPSQTHSNTRTPSNPEEQKIQPAAASSDIPGAPKAVRPAETDKVVSVHQQTTTASPEQTGTVASPETSGNTTDLKAVNAANATTKTDSNEGNLLDSSAVAGLTTTKSGVTENKNKKNVTWLLQAGAGMSNMGDLNILPIGGQKSADQLQNSMNPSVVVPTPARSDKAGLNVSIGLQRKQTLSKRLQWSASLAWQYQQIHQYKGVKIDSVISLTSAGSNFSNNYFYTPGSNASEKGSNNRIILTNELSWQVLKNQTWFRLGAGLYTGYNIANNYYVADHMQRLVKNDGLYSKAFVGFTPSLQFELKNNIKVNLNTHIDFTKAYKELNGDAKYWRGWEVRADFPIFRK